MENQNQFTDENLVAMIRKDCRRQAEAAEIKLGQVIDCLSDENHLGALGAFVGLDEDMAGLRVFLVRMAMLTSGQTSTRSEQSAQPEVQKGEKRSRGKNAKARNSL